MCGVEPIRRSRGREERVTRVTAVSKVIPLLHGSGKAPGPDTARRRATVTSSRALRKDVPSVRMSCTVPVVMNGVMSSGRVRPCARPSWMSVSVGNTPVSRALLEGCGRARAAAPRRGDQPPAFNSEPGTPRRARSRPASCCARGTSRRERTSAIVSRAGAGHPTRADQAQGVGVGTGQPVHSDPGRSADRTRRRRAAMPPFRSSSGGDAGVREQSHRRQSLMSWRNHAVGSSRPSPWARHCS